MSLVWINGQLVDKSEAKISVFDHGLLYGDGAWAHFRAFNGTLFRPNWELGKLYSSLNGLSLHIQMPLSQEDLVSAIEGTLHANKRKDGYIRVIVTRGSGTL